VEQNDEFVRRGMRGLDEEDGIVPMSEEQELEMDEDDWENGYTSSDSITKESLTQYEWRLHQVKTRTFASNPDMTQTWLWVREGIVEHQVLNSVSPPNWAVYGEPYNFHLSPRH
jgi:hypothetical protein